MSTEELTGEVVAVIFVNDTTGFAVVEMASDDADDGARASGPLASLVPGQSVRLLGRWVDHERYGPTFEAVAYDHAPPTSEPGLEAFLASERFAGVGKALAHRIVGEFGMDLGKVLEAEPERLAGIRGISLAKAESIAAAWRSAGALSGLVADLTAAGMTPATALAVSRHFGESAAETIAADPYAVLAVRGVRWGQAERLARAAGIERDDPRRLAAGALAAQRERCGRGGHMAATTDEVVAEARRLLGTDAITTRRALDLAVAADSLVSELALWWTPVDRRAEQWLADDLARLLAATSRVPAGALEGVGDTDLTDEQRDAVEAALTTPVSVLTGGPGTGKTHTVRAIVAACEDVGASVALCAPTGRAAKRLEELTGRAATTVHRLLEARGVPGEGFSFGYDRLRRLPFDAVVADEWSMADTRLAGALAAAMADGAHLVLVGDADQLPSVGSGAVLRDLLSADTVPATRLTRIHRQAAASRIVTLAHQINDGSVPELRGRDNDVFVVPEHPALVADRVAEIVAVRAPAFYGIAPEQVQVLSPMYRGPAGVHRLNERLKERLNPAAGRRAVAGFHEGDKVVMTRNDAELDVANGDIGEVVATSVADRTVEVAFPGGAVTFDGERAGDLAPAWCLTVHKAQGGEWPVVVLALDGDHRVMLWRELVYTAVTRARHGLLLVGDARLVGSAAARTGSGARSRITRLPHRLAAALAGEP